MFWETGIHENGTNTNDSYSSMGNHDCGDSFYSPIFGMCISMPEWEALLTIVALGLVIIITIVGKYVYRNVISFLCF